MYSHNQLFKTNKIFGLMLLVNKYNNKISYLTLKCNIILQSSFNNLKSKVDKITFCLYIFSSRITNFRF